MAIPENTQDIVFLIQDTKIFSSLFLMFTSQETKTKKAIKVVAVTTFFKLEYTPSLSYDPATEREIYPGTIAIIAAATSPDAESFTVTKQNINSST
jgi:hypothetical protein